MSAEGTSFDGLDAEEQVGLRLPDGTIVWPPETVQGYSLETDESRAAVVAALRRSAEDLHIPADQLLQNYLWVIRKKITVTVAQVIGAFPVTAEQDQESAPEADA